MSKRLDMGTAERMRSDARRLEQYADAQGEYPAGTVVRRGQGPSRMFNVRLTDEQYQQLERVAKARHLPVSTMARAWLLDRLEGERDAS
jgi:hypothetical protein